MILLLDILTDCSCSRLYMQKTCNTCCSEHRLHGLLWSITTPPLPLGAGLCVSACAGVCVRVTDTQRSGWFNFVRKLIFETRSQDPLPEALGRWLTRFTIYTVLSLYLLSITLKVLLIELTVSFITPCPFHFGFHYNEWQAFCWCGTFVWNFHFLRHKVRYITAFLLVILTCMLTWVL